MARGNRKIKAARYRRAIEIEDVLAGWAGLPGSVGSGLLAGVLGGLGRLARKFGRVWAVGSDFAKIGNAGDELVALMGRLGPAGAGWSAGSDFEKIENWSAGSGLANVEYGNFAKIENWNFEKIENGNFEKIEDY